MSAAASLSESSKMAQEAQVQRRSQTPELDDWEKDSDTDDARPAPVSNSQKTPRARPARPVGEVEALAWPGEQKENGAGAMAPSANPAPGARVILARPPAMAGQSRPGVPMGLVSRGSSASSSSSGSAPRASAVPTPPPPPPPADDDPWSHIGPSSTAPRSDEDATTSNRRVWAEANNANRAPASMPLLPANAPPVPPSNSLRILRRPSPGGTPGSSGSSTPAGALSGSGNGNRPIKSLSERELEYQRARERIFGSEDAGVSGVSTPGSSSTNTSQAGDSSETESKASGSVEGSGRRKKRGSEKQPQQQPQPQHQRRDGSATPPTTAPSARQSNGRPKRGEPTSFEMLRPPKADRRSASRGPGPGSGPGPSDSGVVRQPIGPDELSLGFRNLHVQPRADTYPYGGPAAGPAFGGYYGAYPPQVPMPNARAPPPSSGWHQYPQPPPAFAVDYSLGGYPNPSFGFPGQHQPLNPPPPPPPQHHPAPQSRDGRMPYQPWQ